MKKESINKIKLGMFISFGVVLLLAGLYFIGDMKKMFSTTFRINALFNDVEGLQVGNNVRFAGINVGVIDNIEIMTDTTVKVDMILDKHTQRFIKTDSKAIIGSDGLMGNKILIISAGTYSNAVIKDNEMIESIIPISPDDILLKLKTSVDNTALITGDLAIIMGNIRMGKGTVGKLFMDSTFANNLDNTIINVKQGAKGFNQNMEAVQKSALLKKLLRKKKTKTLKKK